MSVVYRIKCPHCKTPNNIAGFGSNITCPSCKANVDTSNCGFLDLYRMGSPLGIAGGFGIYIDGQPCGYVANKQTIRIILPYGKHNLHVACGMNRGCNDLEINLHEFKRIEYTKVYMKPGFWANSFVLQYAKEAEMSEHDPVPGGARAAVADAAPINAAASPYAQPMQQTQAPVQNVVPVMETRRIFCTSCGNGMDIQKDAHGMLACPKCNNSMNV